MNKILFIAPHPDDETLGCGGTILKSKENGDQIYWLIMTNISAEDGYDQKKVTARQEEINVISKEYGFNDVFKLDFPTIKLDTIARSLMIEKISNVMNQIKPDIVYLPNKNDVHSDHGITFDALMSATKTFRYPFIRRILMYETISETEFSPAIPEEAFVTNSFSDISEYLDKKITLMNIYKGEMGEHPFPRSAENIKALATFRGATAGVKYAEAFMILKEIN